MKNLTISFMLAFLFLTGSPTSLKAITISTIEITDPAKTAEQAQAEVLISRLNDIKEMDKVSGEIHYLLLPLILTHTNISLTLYPDFRP